MPRMISFALTTQQFIDGTKDVTRRLAWEKAKAGDVLMAVEKAMGLGKGGKVKRLGLIQVVDVRREQLDALIYDGRRGYGVEECRREGFPHMTPCEFINFFTEANDCNPWDAVTRIEFKKVAG